jgi:putative ABC transport system substrate-binding protein
VADHNACPAGRADAAIGVLLPAAANDPEFQAWVSAFLQGLQQSGWIIGRNVQIDTHWATPNPAEIRRNAAELVALKPDVILAPGAVTVGPLQQTTRTIPSRRPAWSTAWRGRAATPPVSWFSNTA